MEKQEVISIEELKQGFCSETMKQGFLWSGYSKNQLDDVLNQRDIFQHVPIIFRKPVKPDSMGVPGFSPFGDVHMSFRIPPRLDARE